MAKNNYYAVKNGHKIGIFESWVDCSKQVHGFKGAIYKGFPNLKEAEAYLEGQESKVSHGYESEEEIMADIKDGEMIAYVDGSNRGDGSAFAWGIVTFSNELGKQTINGMSTNPNQIKYRNIAGELFASVKATKYAMDNKMTKITIYHDYSGIRHWALGEWKTKNKLSQDYEAFFKSAKRYIEFEFVKVEGHTGDKFNEEADVLAKKALGIKV
ncbi:MAG TPA: RNase H [Clostridiales bacterium]|nr:RNase H [Clostridiales bacterium]